MICLLLGSTNVKDLHIEGTSSPHQMVEWSRSKISKANFFIMSYHTGKNDSQLSPKNTHIIEIMVDVNEQFQILYPILKFRVSTK